MHFAFFFFRGLASVTFLKSTHMKPFCCCTIQLGSHYIIHWSNANFCLFRLVLQACKHQKCFFQNAVVFFSTLFISYKCRKSKSFKIYEYTLFTYHLPKPNCLLQKRLPMYGSRSKRQPSCDSDPTGNSTLMAVVSGPWC